MLDRYANTFRVTGCPNLIPDLSSWLNESDEVVMQGFYDICVAVEEGAQRGMAQRDKCCGDYDPCRPFCNHQKHFTEEFHIGEPARVRDSLDQSWKTGKVVSFDPMKVLPDG